MYLQSNFIVHFLSYCLLNAFCIQGSALGVEDPKAQAFSPGGVKWSSQTFDWQHSCGVHHFRNLCWSSMCCFLSLIDCKLPEDMRDLFLLNA